MPIRVQNKVKLKSEVWFVFHQTYESLYKCEEEAFEKVGIPAQQFQVLWALKNMPRCVPQAVTTTSVANWLDRNHTSISLIIDRMIKNGLVERKKDLLDRRTSRLVITPKGETVYLSAVKTAKELPEKVFSGFNRQQLTTLSQLLSRIREETFDLRKIQDRVIDVRMPRPE
jgi:MarR family transcriptional regulator, organic hydroperoxide resistance regulator